MWLYGRTSGKNSVRWIINLRLIGYGNEDNTFDVMIGQLWRGRLRRHRKHHNLVLYMHKVILFEADLEYKLQQRRHFNHSLTLFFQNRKLENKEH